MSTLVLAWHGTRSATGRAAIDATGATVAALLPGTDVHTAWVDPHTVPDADSHRILGPTLARLGDCTLVPCFLAAGFHVRHDIAEAVAQASGHVRVTPHLGGAFGSALADRVAEAGGPGDAVVLAVVASRRDAARAEVARVADQLAHRLGVRVSVANLFGDPSVPDAVAAARSGGARDVLVLPYTLAPGLWTDRVAGLGVRVAAPLGDHADVTAAILGRARSAMPLATTSLGR